MVRSIQMSAEPSPWNPSKRTRILIGVATVWPVVYFAFFMAAIGAGFWLSRRPDTAHRADLFKYIFPLHCFAMLTMFALTAVYIVHAVKNPELRQEMRIIWVIILFMGNMFAFPVYWWLYLRPGARPSGNVDAGGSIQEAPIPPPPDSSPQS